jgi:cytochrome c oxidase assembly protein subunit 15
VTTLVAVYVLILVGGIVRSTGAGMGCPDWPKCFGRWVPPTSDQQLPPNYKEVYVSIREKKNLRFANYMAAIGFTSTADKIKNDASILVEKDFNVAKAWIEYGNRLVGVIIGFLIAMLFWRSMKLKTTHPRIFFFSLATLTLVIVQGWFGSIVVSTNLTDWTVTVHMFLALMIVGLIIYLIHLSQLPAAGPDQAKGLGWILVACMLALFIQIFLGSQVRQSLDRIATGWVPRNQWIGALGLEFIIHRSFSHHVMARQLLFGLKIRKKIGPKKLLGGLINFILF